MQNLKLDLRILKKVSQVILVLGLFLQVSNVFAVTGIGRVIFMVIQEISVAEVSPLSFASAKAGDSAQTVVPTAQESAKFQVRGEANRSVQISLPAAVELELNQNPNSEKSDSNKKEEPSKVTISDFKSLPAKIGSLDASGELIISVGATRDKLSKKQKPGKYEGSYTIDVVY